MARFGVKIVCAKCGRELTEEELTTKRALRTNYAECRGCGHLANLEYDEIEIHQYSHET